MQNKGWVHFHPPLGQSCSRRVTALLLLVLAAEGVRLAGREVWLHSKSSGEKRGRTSTAKAESLKALGLDSSFSK